VLTSLKIFKKSIFTKLFLLHLFPLITPNKDCHYYNKECLKFAVLYVKNILFLASPVISGNNIYSLKPPSEKEREIEVNDYNIKIKQVKVFSASSNSKTLLMFLNNGLRNMFSKIGYTEIGKTGKFFQVKNA
jgi:hypothetical protein